MNTTPTLGNILCGIYVFILRLAERIVATANGCDRQEQDARHLTLEQQAIFIVGLVIGPLAKSNI